MTTREHYEAIDRDRPLTLAEAKAYIALDAGDAPASRYGRKAGQWAPVALALWDIMGNETGERTLATLEADIGLVVNDADGVAYIIANYGAEHGYAAEDYLEPEDIAEALREQGATE